MAVAGRDRYHFSTQSVIFHVHGKSMQFTLFEAISLLETKEFCRGSGPGAFATKAPAPY